MIELLKDIALTLAVVGGGLCILLPALVNVYAVTGMVLLSGAMGINNRIKDKLISFLYVLLSFVSTGIVGAYFIFSLYYIWIK